MPRLTVRLPTLEHDRRGPRSEWIKLRSVTSTIVLYIAVAGVSVGIGLLVTIAVPLDTDDVRLSDRLPFARPA